MKILPTLATTLEKQKLNFSRRALFHMENKVSLKYFVNGCSYESMFTSIINFQNTMKQTGNISGALWCFESVYHIAGEIQLLWLDSFDIVFLALANFHMLKVVMVCLGK